jgi:hypothetical protein
MTTLRARQGPGSDIPRATAQVKVQLADFMLRAPGSDHVSKSMRQAIPQRQEKEPHWRLSRLPERSNCILPGANCASRQLEKNSAALVSKKRTHVISSACSTIQFFKQNRHIIIVESTPNIHSNAPEVGCLAEPYWPLFQGWNMTAENPSENPEIALRLTGSNAPIAPPHQLIGRKEPPAALTVN